MLVKSKLKLNYTGIEKKHKNDFIKTSKNLAYIDINLKIMGLSK